MVKLFLFLAYVTALLGGVGFSIIIYDGWLNHYPETLTGMVLACSVIVLNIFLYILAGAFGYFLIDELKNPLFDR